MSDPAFVSAEDPDRVLAQVPPGEYAVILSILDFPPSPVGMSSSRATAAMVQISDAPAVEWKTLTDSNDQQVWLGIDAGVGCIYDAGHRDLLQSVQSDEERLDAAFDSVLTTQFAALVDGAGKPSVVFFDCGMGDGGYPAWLGFSEDGDVSSALIDLELLSHCTDRIS